MFFRSRYFPKHLFVRFVALQLLSLLPALLLAALGARAYLASRLGAVGDVAEATALFDRTMFLLASFTAVTITGAALWGGYRFVLPLGRVLLKARSIQKRDYSAPSRE